MLYRTRLPDDAVTLAQHGWTPSVVRAARGNPNVFWTDRETGPTPRPEEEIAALVLLANETAKYHELCANLVRELRAQYISDFAERLPGGKLWSHERVASLLCLTRQRVRMILKLKTV